MTPPDHSTEITLKDVWTSVNDVSKNINEMKLKVSTIDTRTEEVVKYTTDHEQRLRTIESVIAIMNDVPDRLTTVEHRVWSIPGFSVILGVGSLIVSFWHVVKG